MSKFNSIGLIVIAAALFMLFTKPQMAKISALNEQKAAYQQAISDMEQIDQKKNMLLAKLNSFPAEDVQKIDTLLPDKPNIVPLIAEIENVASKHNITLTDIETESGNFSSSVGTQAPARNYESATISFSFDASYENMKLLLTDIESSLRILDIRSIDFKGQENGLFNYKVSLDIYWVSPDVTASPQPLTTPI